MSSVEASKTRFVSAQLECTAKASLPRATTSHSRLGNPSYLQRKTVLVSFIDATARCIHLSEEYCRNQEQVPSVAPNRASSLVPQTYEYQLNLLPPTLASCVDDPVEARLSAPSTFTHSTAGLRNRAAERFRRSDVPYNPFDAPDVHSAARVRPPTSSSFS